MTTFNGFPRPDGRVGVRNHVAVIACEASVNAIVRKVAAETGAQPVTHDHDDYLAGPDAELVLRSLRGMANHPNAGAVVLVGLDDFTCSVIADGINGKPFKVVSLANGGGARGAVDGAIEAVRDFTARLGGDVRVSSPVSELHVGLKCGGSDSMSGLSCNPALGAACDILVDYGGTAVLTETSGIYGAEFILAGRAVNPDVARRIYEIVDKVERDALALGMSLAQGNPSPGNIEGGLTTLAEKSLGTIKKCGSRPIQAVIAFGEEIRIKGVVIMDTPGLDVYSVAGPVSGGAQIEAFTTGRGSPLGAPLTPVQKIMGNPENYLRMSHNMDINAGTVITGERSLEQVGREIFNHWVAIANGALTKAERWGHTEYALPRSGTVL